MCVLFTDIQTVQNSSLKPPRMDSMAQDWRDGEAAGTGSKFYSTSCRWIKPSVLDEEGVSQSLGSRDPAAWPERQTLLQGKRRRKKVSLSRRSCIEGHTFIY